MLGIAALKLMLWGWKKVGPALRTDPLRRWFLVAGSLLTLTGLGLAVVGSTLATRPLLYVHLAAAAGFAALLARRRVLFAPLLLAVAIPAGALLRPLLPASGPLLNAGLPPTTMSGEAMGGADGPFFPSAAETRHGGLIPEEFFLGSDACGRCHADITHQWSESAHRFASFNNPWYRRSIEYMQDVVGVTPSKWCAGCHDHAVLFSGLMDQPIAEIVDRPSASAGLGCVSC
ncbi:MAG: multiheme c-type cytochrome, partial [Acidobacteria bacterium]|nr:multiheme c-type cytochrome [Acidobacteriota bacterium]